MSVTFLECVRRFADANADRFGVARLFAMRATIRVERTEAEVADAALRLIRLMDRPDSIPILQGQLIREMHYWLLIGRHGGGIRALGFADSHAKRIARAVGLIRNAYAPMPNHCR